jgi:hypothetical protein
MQNRELFPSWVFGIASKIWEGSLPAEYLMRSVFWAFGRRKKVVVVRDGEDYDWKQLRETVEL